MGSSHSKHRTVEVDATRVIIPVAGDLPLTAEVLGVDDDNDIDKTTFVVRDCTTSASSCALYEPLTITAGPDTYHFEGSGYWYRRPCIRIELTSITDLRREALGKLDCDLYEYTPTYPTDASVTRSAECAWTVGRYPSSEVSNLTNSWITTPAPSSTIIWPTITDRSAHTSQAYVNVAVTGTTLYSTIYGSSCTLQAKGWEAGMAGLFVLLVLTWT